jgi:hypothetical protein
LKAAFVSAEAAGGALVRLFFPAEVDGPGLVGRFPVDLDDVAEPVALTLLAFCRFLTVFRFFFSGVPCHLPGWVDPSASGRVGLVFTGPLSWRCG